MTEKRDHKKLRDALAERMNELCHQILGAPTFSSHGDDWRYRRKGSLSVNIQTGRWFDNDPPDDQKSGGPLDFIMRGGDGGSTISLQEACRIAEAFLATRQEATLHSSPTKALSEEERIAYALAMWDQSIPITGTLAETYLRRRGIRGPLPSDLRFNPKCWHSETRQHLPAMVAAMRNLRGNAISGVHRTFLKTDGSGKADVQPNKKMLGRHKATVIKLTEVGEVEDVLCLTEGIENGLSANALGYSSVWVAGCAGGIASLGVVPRIRNLIVFADHDKTGLRAAHDCARVWRAAGRLVRVLMPPTPGHDLNDLLMARTEQ